MYAQFVHLKGLTKMANVIISLRIMPESVEVDLNKIQEEAKEVINKYAGEGEIRSSKEPIAFGLNSVNLIFVMDEKLGGTDPLEDQLRNLEGVQSVEVTDVRRAIG